MKKPFLILVTVSIIIGLGSCSVRKYNERFDRLYAVKKTIEIETLVEDSTLNVRALEVVNSKFAFPVYLTSKGEFGVIMPNGIYNQVDSLRSQPFYNHKINLSTDSLKLNFRALSISENKGFWYYNR